MSALQRFADWLWIALGHYLACLIREDVWHTRMTTATVIALVTFNLAAEWRGLYRPWRAERLTREVRVAVTTWLVVPPVLMAFGFVTKSGASFSRAVTLMWMFALTPAMIVLWRVLGRVIVRQMRAHGKNRRTVAIVGATPISEKLCLQIIHRSWLGMQLTGLYDARSEERRYKFTEVNIPYAGNLEQLVKDAREGKIDIVYISLPLRAEARIAALLQALADTTATVYLTADFFTYDLLNARWHQIGNVPLVSIYDSPFSGVAGYLKRVEDIVIGSLILLLISIPMLFIAIAIKFTSKGPVFFIQRRFGLNGKPIRVLKFRSMTVCEDGDVIKQATKNDQRITKLGAFMRRTSLDELPQFLQVITGEMSIVGPRPHAVAHNQSYRSLIKGYMLRHKVKPGITGWAQVNGFRGETDTLDKMEQRVKYDLEYITDWHLGWDLKIILLTIFGSAKNRGAY